ncbi:hypothetical protein [Tepidibacillus decaturensis]|uniref:hypothetical protein n=1 Tax=Tepidibacillus decaturensis TaxID=1413211 RepID=UPI00137B8BA8|nr:hypothetical protein [Tepidibacillus decaturensis]
MKNIIIFYQVINREIESCKMLKKELETKNDIKAFIFQLTLNITKPLISVKDRKSIW